ncbi:MAG: riboflavin synthase [Gammaproteobacteria bacterium]
MFTGIVQGTGRVRELEGRDRDAKLCIRWLTSGLARGDSVAVSGVCLTATEIGGDTLTMDVSAETLARSTLGRLRAGDEVNLERALKVGDPLGGHLVSGHVDGVGQVIDRAPAGASVRLIFAAPAALARYIATKGSIAVDGVSLTVNEVRGAEFTVNIVPHTLEMTTLKACVPGTRVNLEVDVIARYLERLLLGQRAAQAAPDSGSDQGLKR